MSTSNGVIRIGRKGLRKFAFGDDGEPFEVDVVVAFQLWICIDEEFRNRTEDRSIATADMSDYHRAAVHFVTQIATPVAERGMSISPVITTAEALDFIARLREQYDELVSFFRPKSRGEPESPATSEAELRFSVEES